MKTTPCKTLTLPLALALVLGFPLAASPVHAAELAGVQSPDNTKVDGQALVLNGMALRKKFIVKVYVASLYLSAKESQADKILKADSPRQMVMNFLYAVGKDKMVEAWSEGLANNTPNASADVKQAFAQLAGFMEDIPKGGKIVLTYVPGTGTKVEVNGKTKGTLPGKATADAILNTWLGPKPGPGADFKKAVLGG